MVPKEKVNVKVQILLLETDVVLTYYLAHFSCRTNIVWSGQKLSIIIKIYIWIIAPIMWYCAKKNVHDILSMGALPTCMHTYYIGHIYTEE